MSADLVLEFVGIFIGVCALFFILKKIYFRFFLKKKYYIFARISVKGISNIGMIIALSVAVVLLLIFITADLASVVFRLWTGTRIIIEGILIKIGGLLFGPIVGMAMGAIIDFLTIAITAGVFHIGYFVTAILFGLLGGIVRSLIIGCKNKPLLFTFWSTLFTLVLMAIIIVLMWFNDTSPQKYSVTLLGIDISITKTNLIILLSTTTLIPVVILWISYLISRFKTVKKIKNKNWYMVFAPVFVTIIISELICNVVLAPVFDAMLSPLGYSAWVLIRLLLFIPMIILNLLIIFPVYNVVKPLINYNYEDDALKEIDCKQKNRISFKQLWKEIVYEK